jgi:hypothetical protein
MTDHHFSTPHWYAINGRPVTAQPTADGGLDILAFDWATGELVRELDYLTKVVLPDTDTDELTHAEFDALVQDLRSHLHDTEPTG